MRSPFLVMSLLIYLSGCSGKAADKGEHRPATQSASTQPPTDVQITREPLAQTNDRRASSLPKSPIDAGTASTATEAPAQSGGIAHAVPVPEQEIYRVIRVAWMTGMIEKELGSSYAPDDPASYAIDLVSTGFGISKDQAEGIARKGDRIEAWKAQEAALQFKTQLSMLQVRTGKEKRLPTFDEYRILIGSGANSGDSVLDLAQRMSRTYPGSQFNHAATALQRKTSFTDQEIEAIVDAYIAVTKREHEATATAESIVFASWDNQTAHKSFQSILRKYERRVRRVLEQKLSSDDFQQAAGAATLLAVTYGTVESIPLLEKAKKQHAEGKYDMRFYVAFEVLKSRMDEEK